MWNIIVFIHNYMYFVPGVLVSSSVSFINLCCSSISLVLRICSTLTNFEVKDFKKHEAVYLLTSGTLSSFIIQKQYPTTECKSRIFVKSSAVFPLNLPPQNFSFLSSVKVKNLQE